MSPRNLKPVSILTTSTPIDLAISAPNSDVTTVLIMQALSANLPFSLRPDIVYSASSPPIWLPVNNTTSPAEFLTATPTLSQSGSFAIRMSASSFFRSSIPLVRATLSSGLGVRIPAKFGSGISSSGTTRTFLKPLSFKTLRTGTLPVPQRGEYTTLNSPAYLSMISFLITLASTASIKSSSIDGPSKVILASSSFLKAGIVEKSFIVSISAKTSSAT